MAFFRSSLAEMRQKLARLETTLNQLPAHPATVKAEDAATFDTMKLLATKLIHCFLELPDEEFLQSAHAPYAYDDARPTYVVIVEQAMLLLNQANGNTEWEALLHTRLLSQAKSDADWERFLTKNGLSEGDSVQ